MSILSIQGVEKHFGGLTVLDGVDMELEQGKLYQLIGPNGIAINTVKFFNNDFPKFGNSFNHSD